MKAFTTAELTSLRVAQESAMQDTGNVETYSESFNTFGEPVPSFAHAADIACGLDMKPGSINLEPNKTTVIYDATVRIPISTAVKMSDNFRVTKRFGETLATALVFNIVGTIQRGPSGIRLMLQKVDV
jgi:hypothetical protein